MAHPVLSKTPVKVSERTGFSTGAQGWKGPLSSLLSNFGKTRGLKTTGVMAACFCKARIESKDLE